MKGCNHTGCTGKHLAKGFCAAHYKMPSKINPKPIKRSATPIKRSAPTIKKSTPIKRATPIARSSKPIKKKSASQIKRDQKYMPIRNKFLMLHPECQAQIVPECGFFATEVHHSKGKTGDLYYEAKWFVALCAACHRHVEVNVIEAKEKGFSHDRDL